MARVGVRPQAELVRVLLSGIAQLHLANAAEYAQTFSDENHR